MNIFRLFFELFVIYIVYKLIFDFIIPIYKTTKQVKQKVSDMQQRMQEQQEISAVNGRFSQRGRNDAPRPAQEDYIDYEEVK